MRIIFATGNEGKMREIRDILAGMEAEIVSMKEAGLSTDVEETGTTFAENAVLKAEALANICNKPCLADDSGLCVDALGGRPGVYSARYAPNRDFDKAMTMLIGELKESKSNDWSAHFACVLALKEPDKDVKIFEGRVDGKIIEERKGENGFGFDPVFMPDGFDRTFAEMSGDEKKQISHRGRAVAKFLQQVLNG